MKKFLVSILVIAIIFGGAFCAVFLPNNMAMMTLWTQDYDKMFETTATAIERLNDNQYYDLKIVYQIKSLETNEYYDFVTDMKMTVIDEVYEFVATTTVETNVEEAENTSYTSCYKDGTFYTTENDTKVKSVRSADSAIGSFNDSGLNILIPDTASTLTAEGMIYASTDFKFSLSPFYIGQTIRYRDVEQLNTEENEQLIADISAFGNMKYFGYLAETTSGEGTFRYEVGTHYLSNASFTLVFPTDLDTYILAV